MDNIYNWDSETGIAICKIFNPNTGKYEIGQAKCHPQDMDMISEHFGMELAETRAGIKLIKSNIKKLKIQRDVIKELYTTLQDRSDFDYNDPATRITRKKLNNYNDDIEAMYEILRHWEESIKIRINAKEKLYHRIRMGRQNKNVGDEAPL